MEDKQLLVNIFKSLGTTIDSIDLKISIECYAMFVDHGHRIELVYNENNIRENFEDLFSHG